MAHRSSRFSIFTFFALPAVLVLLFTGMSGATQAQDWKRIWRVDFSGPVESAPNPNYWTLQQGLTRIVQLPLRIDQRVAFHPAIPLHFVKADHDGRANLQEVSRDAWPASREVLFRGMKEEGEQNEE
jgi:hypothetical protein